MKHHELRTQPVLFVAHSGDDEFLGALRRYCTQFEVLVSQWMERAGRGVSWLKQSAPTCFARIWCSCCSRSGALQSAWVNQEIGLAAGLGKTLLPVRVGERVALPGLLERKWSASIYLTIRSKKLRCGWPSRSPICFRRRWSESFPIFATTVNGGRRYPRSNIRMGSACGRPGTISGRGSRSPGTAQRHPLPDPPARLATLRRGDDQDPFRRRRDRDRCRGAVGASEIHVFGNLTVETFYPPEFAAEIEGVLSRYVSEVELRKWFSEMIGEPRKIEVRLSMDPDRAAAQRESLCWLYERYRTAEQAPARKRKTP